MPLKDCFPFLHPSITTADMTDEEFTMEKNNQNNFINCIDHLRVKYLEMIDTNTFWIAFKDSHNLIWRLKVYFPEYQVLPVIKEDDFKKYLEKHLASTANPKGCHILTITGRDYEKNLIMGELHSYADLKKNNSLTNHLVMNAKAILREEEEPPEETQPTTPPVSVTIPPPPPEGLEDIPEEDEEEENNEANQSEKIDSL